MDIKKMLAYAVLFVTIFMLWTQWQVDHPKTSKPQAVTSTSKQTATDQTVVAPKLNSTGLSKKKSSNGSLSDQADVIHVQTDTLNLSIDLNGGNLVQSKLLNYKSALDTPTIPFVLLNNSKDDTYLAQSGLMPGGDTGETLHYQAAQKNYVFSKTDKKQFVDLVATTKNGLKVTKRYTFQPDSYQVQLSYRIKNTANTVWKGRYFLQLVRSNTPSTSNNMARYTFFGAALSSPDDHYKKIKFSKIDQVNNQQIRSGWAAMIQHYFVSAWVPNSHLSFQYFGHGDEAKNMYTIGMASPSFAINPGQTVTKTATLYTGPAIATRLEKASPFLKLTIDYGWFWFISVFLFWVMNHIHHFVGNWGWSIVFTTMVVKLVLYKLSDVSYRSMAKMKKLQPKMKALQEQYKGDKAALSKATMEMYRKEKANPLGGCLPMLIQIPVFLGLYWLIIESVQLRHAPFIFWIHDLSVKDPYFVLPVIMGLTMLIQQKLSPPPPDPMQAKVMLALPLVFTFFFLSFPAGLVLYWVVNNSLSVLQMSYAMKKYGKETVKKKKKRKQLT
jgi:YidC/Oxa1 family membrane protein insertase